MKSLALGIAAAGLLVSGAGFAQTSTGAAPAGSTPNVAASPMTSGGPGTPPAAGTAGALTNRLGNPSSASGNNNQAVATTSANAPAPAKGSSSFTMGQAKSRIEDSGFQNVGGLTKDNDGVWRGQAQKNGSTTMVWLDYKGNVGQGK